MGLTVDFSEQNTESVKWNTGQIKLSCLGRRMKEWRKMTEPNGHLGYHQEDQYIH